MRVLRLSVYNDSKMSCCCRSGGKIALCVARGIAFLHSKNIAWFDCKPGNVLVNRDGTFAKIADFGLSRILEGGFTNTVLVRTAKHVVYPFKCASLWHTRTAKKLCTVAGL